MYIVMKTDFRGIVYTYKNINDIDITFTKYEKTNKNHLFIYKISENQLKEIKIKPLVSFKIIDDLFRCYLTDNIDQLLISNKRSKIIANVEPITLPELFFNEISFNKITYLTTEEVLNKIVIDKLICHGTIAELYYSIYLDTYIYDENKTEKEQCWFVLNKYGIYEIYDETLPPARKNIPGYVCNILEQRLNKEYTDLQGIMIPDKKKKKKLLENFLKFKKTCIKFLNTKCNIGGIIEFLKNYYGKTNIFEKIDKVSKYIIAFNNGVYDIKNKIFRNGTKEELISTTTGYNYKYPDKKYFDFINKLLSDLIPQEEDRIYILKKTSLVLIDGNPLQEFYVIVGSGSNGKGIYVKLIQIALGKYCGAMNPDYFDKSIINKDADKPCETLSKNKNSRAVIIDEMEASFEISGNKIRRITGGSTLPCRPLRGHLFNYVAGYIPIFASNYELAFDTSAEHGIRRIDVWRSFRNEFVDKPTNEWQKKKNSKLTEILESDTGYALAFFHILLKYYHIFNEQDNLKIERSKIMQEERNEMITENDPIGVFMNEYTEKTNEFNDKITGSELFKAFIIYNRGGNIKYQLNHFYQVLRNKHYIVKDFHKQKVVRNIKIKKQLPTNNQDYDVIEV